MQYSQFIEAVQHRAQFDGDNDDGQNHAEQAAIATLNILGLQLASYQAYDLAAQLPGELRDLLTQGPEEGNVLDVEAFLLRIADEEGLGCDTDQARAHAHAVLSTLAAFIGSDELAQLRIQLPDGYAPFFERVSSPLAG